MLSAKPEARMQMPEIGTYGNAGAGRIRKALVKRTTRHDSAQREDTLFVISSDRILRMLPSTFIDMAMDAASVTVSEAHGVERHEFEARGQRQDSTCLRVG